MRRDPKGIYQKGKEGKASNVPGLQVPYEPPENPDVVIRSGVDTLEAGVREIVSKLVEKKFIQHCLKRN
jgi:adenylylsulfate kinase-like enzyme